MVETNKFSIIGALAVTAIALLPFLKKPRPTLPDNLNVGYTIQDFAFNGRTITTAIWYPTIDEPSLYDYNRATNPGMLALDGSVYTGSVPYPLVLFSHGYLGCGVQSSYISQYLARNGYIVAAPDHEDASLCSIKGGMSAPPDIDETLDPFFNFPNRLVDMKALADYMILENQTPGSPFYKTIKTNAICISGHSIGGWTAQVLSGATPEEFAHYKDNRIKATLLFAPNTNQIAPEDFSKMNKPVSYMLGDNDLYHLFEPQDVPRSIGYDYALPPKYLQIVLDCGHFDFTDTTCLVYSDIEACQLENPQASVILKYALAFLDGYLWGIKEAKEVLKSIDPRLASVEYVK